MSNRLRILLAFALLACGGVLRSQVVVSGYTQTGSLPANDDDYSAAVNLGFTINFGGTNYSSAYVSNNGYLTFGSGSGDYTPSAFNTSYEGPPIIAAFFSDVDTRGAGSGLVEWGTGTVNGNAAFVAKWNNVGEYYYEDHPGVFNSFAIVLVDRHTTGTGNFDVFFNYSAINWDHGGAGAGFHNGNYSSPLYYQVPGSLTGNAFLAGGANDLVHATNTGDAGSLLLQARDGSFLSVGAITAIPEPSTWALLALGGGLILVAARRRAA